MSGEAQAVARVEALSVRFGGPAGALAVQDVSLEVRAGEIVGLVGESGSGKSLTALSLAGLLPRRSCEVSARRLELLGRDVQSLPEAELCRLRGAEVAFVFQEPMTALNPTMRIGALMEEVARRHRGLPRRAAREFAMRQLESVSLTDGRRVMRSYPFELSGGMRQRVLIALAFSMNPRLLVADEPTTALDVTVQADILGLLRRKAQESGAAVLFISHDLALVSQLCHRLYVLRRGRVIESGPTEAVLASQASAFTRTLVRAALQRERCEVRRPAAGAPATSGGRRVRGDAEGAVLALHDVGKVFVTARTWLGRPRSTVEAVRHVTLAVGRGEVVGVIGESGSGKTTLARLAQGLIAPTTGSVIRRVTTQMVFQDPKSTMNPRLPAWRIVTEPAAIARRLSSPSLRRLAEELLEQVGVGAERAGHYLHQFSGGQRQRLAVARALSCRPELLILDEPTSALDVAVQAQILDLLQAVQREYGLTYLLISHDVSVVRRLSTQVAVMRHGEIVEWGDAHRLLDGPEHPYTKALLSAVPTLPGAVES